MGYCIAILVLASSNLKHYNNEFDQKIYQKKCALEYMQINKYRIICLLLCPIVFFICLGLVKLVVARGEIPSDRQAMLSRSSSSSASSGSHASEIVSIMLLSKSFCTVIFEIYLFE